MFYDVPVIEPAGAGRARPGEGSVYFASRSPRGVFLNHPHFRPLFEQIDRLGLVACLHPSLGITNPEPTSAGSFVERVAERLGVGHTVAEPTACLQDNGVFLVAACFQGLLEDLPGLRLALCHAGASWLPLALEKAETFLWLEIPGVFGRRTRPVCLEPAEVAAAHPLLVSFDSWESSVAAMPDLFQDQAAWSSRYPQHDASAPSEALATLARHGVRDEVVARLMGGNARALFRLPAAA
jgi:predicted TIM-barrel fold metal-dependent hydrolase